MVFVLDKHKKPLMPCSEKRARLLLTRSRARIHRMVPFTIRLVDRLLCDSQLQPVALTLDPGSKTTGIAIARAEQPCTDEKAEVRHVLFLIELNHRGLAISLNLEKRSGYRRNRRNRLRYRPCRSDNRTRPAGWLAPSLQHRVDTTMAWVGRLRSLAPVSSIATELVRFDMQLMQDAEISGVEYQQGTLQGYEVREYLLEKFSRTCVYCGAKNTPFQIDHVYPKSKGGSNRAANLVLACEPCNKAKADRSIEEFLAKKPDLLKTILALLKTPLKDAAAVNSTRKALLAALETAGLPVKAYSGGRTKWNRTRFGLPKTHAFDALCVGEVGGVAGTDVQVLHIKATGRGAYKRTRVDKSGFAKGYLSRVKVLHGFQTGDFVRAHVLKGKKIGVHIGRVAVRSSGSFNIQRIGQKTIQGIPFKTCTLIQRADGYAYA